MLRKNLRETVQSDSQKLKNVRFYDSFTKEKPKDKPWIDIYRMYCEYAGGSNVLWTYSPQSIIVYVGILGEFIGCINFEADVQAFPTDFRPGGNSCGASLSGLLPCLQENFGTLKTPLPLIFLKKRDPGFNANNILQ